MPREISIKTYVIATPQQITAIVERLKKKLAARATAAEAVERIVAGEPRQSFGNFTLSFGDVVPDIGGLESSEKGLNE